MMTWVSVVIPVRRSPEAVRGMVDALLTQTYRGPIESILVGDRDEPAWRPLRAEIDAGRVVVVELDAHTGERTANLRRNAGLAAASGDVLCVTDGDSVPAQDWVATAVSLLGDRCRCVAGPTYATVCFAREVYERIGGFDAQFPCMYEDREWFDRVVDSGYGFLYTPRLVAHRLHDGRGVNERRFRKAARGAARRA